MPNDMNYLELKVPPLIVTAVFALMMIGFSRYLPTVQLPEIVMIGVAASSGLVGLAFCGLAIVEFRKHKTTVNPTRPDNVSVFVDSGVYSVSRNPMYVGFSLFLMTLAIILQSPYSIVGIAAFVLYMNRFQICPEEEALRRHFGRQYDDYRRKVRRWL